MIMKTQFRQILKVMSVALVALAMIGLQSCYKRDYTTVNNTTTFDNSNTVTTSLYGIVQDEAGLPVVAAVVKASGYTTLTDDNGLFFFNNITTPSHATTVVVTKDGYFNGSRTLSVNANDKHTVKISQTGLVLLSLQMLLSIKPPAYLTMVRYMCMLKKLILQPI